MPAATSQAEPRGVGLLLALVSAFAFGSSGTVAKPLIAAGLDPLEVTWLRVAGAALLLLPLAVRHRALVRQRPGLIAGFGVFAMAGVQGCYFAAVSRVPVGVALLIEYLAPALVLGWVRFVQRRPVSRAAAVGVVLAVGGLACVVEIWAGLRFDAVGLALALGAAACQASYFVLSDQGSSKGREGDDRPVPHPLGVIAHGALLATVVLTLAARPWGMEWGILGERVSVDGTPVRGVVLLVWMVAVATVVAYVTGVVAVRRLSPQVAGVVACLEAVVATLVAWVVLGEHLGWVQLVGGAVVLLGAAVAQAPGRPRDGAAAEGPASADAVDAPPSRTG
ncbi:EamA family transporter [Streptomyces xiaopingdaonensis]|uniref:EamA family transporter n=1 Tax=Streptomyces xiaopingdaonensis TaxID=1565415 RepID=UPI0002E55661|nr:EamA family transporter [Streptomyces xiaopingdaonensis]